MAHIEEIPETPQPQTPESKHDEIARAFVPIKEGCLVLEELLFKHFRNMDDPRVKTMLTINHQLKKLRMMLSSNYEEVSSDVYYTVSV
jgi:hypothetical protein